MAIERTGLMDAYSELLKKEEQVRQMIDELIAELEQEVRETSDEGVTVINGPNNLTIAKVTLSKLSEYDNWSPSTFIPAEQAKAVHSVLDKASITDVAAKVRSLLEVKAVKGKKGDTIHLNKKTIETIRNSDLGKFALES